MLIQGDASALEWRCAAFLSQDKVALQEILNGVDQHTDNQKRFGLPSRLIAKTFVFRLIYGGSAFSYANDPNFAEVSRSEKFWQKVIDEFYSKYQGLHSWHTTLVQQATLSGKVELPTGRIYRFQPQLRRGTWVWPRTTILNYPVQGLGADLMSIARVTFHNRLRKAGLKGVLEINTVHDSLIADSPTEYVDEVCFLMLDSFKDIPLNFKRLFGVDFNVPMAAEVHTGMDWKNMEVFVDTRK